MPVHQGKGGERGRRGKKEGEDHRTPVAPGKGSERGRCPLLFPLGVHYDKGSLL